MHTKPEANKYVLLYCLSIWAVFMCTVCPQYSDRQDTKASNKKTRELQLKFPKGGRGVWVGDNFVDLTAVSCFCA